MWIQVIILMWLLIVSVWDARGCYVPLWILAGGSCAILVAALGMCCETADYVRFGSGMIPGAILLILGLITKMVGYGDGMAIMAMGAYMGVRKCLVMLTIAMFLMAVCSLVLLAAKKVTKNTKLPFLPFLTIGWLMLWGI